METRFREEVVDINSIQDLEDGWEITVLQSPEYLKIPVDSSDLLRRVKRAWRESKSVSMIWDLDTLVIKNVSEVI